MKNNFLLILILLMIMTFSLMAQNKAAVLPFTAGDNIDRFMAAAAGESFNKALSKSDKYTIVNQGDVFRQLTDVSLYLVREFDIQTAVKVGQAVVADVVFTGNVFKSGSKVQLSVKCIDAASGTVKFSKNSTVETETLLPDAANLLASQIKLGNESEIMIETQSLTSLELWTKNELEKKNLDVTNQQVMKRLYGGRLAGGISMVVIGTALIGAGAGIIGWGIPTYDKSWNEYDSEKNRLEGEFDLLSEEEQKKYKHYYYSDYTDMKSNYVDSFIGDRPSPTPLLLALIVGPILSGIGCLLDIFSSIPFYAAHQIKSIYHKSVGEKLFAFLQRTSVIGGYDWTNCEATFAMAIKL